MWFDRVANARKIMYFVQRPGHTLWMEEFKKKAAHGPARGRQVFTVASPLADTIEVP